MQRRIASLMAGCLLVALSVTNARALDTITVAGEVKAVAGEIVGVSKTEITIKAGLKKEERKVAANAVLEIRFDKQPAGLNLARNDEAAGRFTAALEKYNAALDDDPSEFLKAELEFLIARTNAQMAMADTTKLAGAVKMLSEFLTSNANSFRYYPALAQLGDVYLAQSNFAEAQATFVKLEQAPWTDYKMAIAAQAGQGRRGAGCVRGGYRHAGQNRIRKNTTIRRRSRQGHLPATRRKARAGGQGFGRGLQ